jgi:uncharacterized protein YkuJ
MTLIQTYCVTLDEKGTYKLDFNTTEPASVIYSTERDGTNVITVNTSKKGQTTFTNNYTSKDGQFKYVFDQPDVTARRIRIPSGEIQP